MTKEAVYSSVNKNFKIEGGGVCQVVSVIFPHVKKTQY